MKELSAELAEPFRIIFETSLRNGKVPDTWKQANVSAIFKKGDKKQPSNYRPVSLTSIPCKVMEKIVRQWILDHMHRNNFLSQQQYGFLSGRSTTLQLLHVLDKWTASLDQGKALDVVYIDFMKAFDSVPHQRLLAKLENYGITGPVLQWIKSFLLGRTQRVGVNGTYSTQSPVTSGIPQGSVLGPPLFVIYINDLPPEVLRALLYLFADDVKMFRVITSRLDVLALQAGLRNMEEWAIRWLMWIHPDKCGFLRVRGARQVEAEALDRDYTIKAGKRPESVPVKEVQQEKDLGVTFDSALSFDTHINNIVSKANQIAGIIRRSFTYLEPCNFVLMFKAFVRPHLEYAQAAWKPHLRKHIDLIERVQRRATKQLPGFKDLSYSERLQKLKLPTLAFRWLRGDMIEVFKILHKIYDEESSRNILDLAGPSRTRGHPLKLAKHSFNKSVRQHYFGLRVVNHWNGLPASVVTAPTLNTFKNRLDQTWNRHPLRFDPSESESYRAPTSRTELDIEATT